MKSVADRTPTPGKEGRVRITFDDGSFQEGILSMADDAAGPGTAWSRDTGRHLQADIRTYPVAAGQTIAVCDLVDIVDGAITKSGTPNQAIALRAGDAGQNIDVLFDGVAEGVGITEGTEIVSEGVCGYAPQDGWIWARPFWSVPFYARVATGSYIGTGTTGSTAPNSLTFAFKPQLVYITRLDAGYPSDSLILLRGQTRGGNLSYSSTQEGLKVQWADTSVSWWLTSSGIISYQLNKEGATYIYVYIG